MPTQYFRAFPSGYYSNRNPLSPPFNKGEDAIFAGENMFHTEKLTLKRRPGRTRWSNQAIASTDVPLGYFSYFDGTNQHVLVDGERNIWEMTPTTKTLLFPKGGSANPASFVAVKDTLYWHTNIVGAAQHKKIATNAYKAWGIARAFGAAATPTITVTAGSVRIRIGWKYRFVYRDSTDAHISSSSQSSVSTGARTAATVTVTAMGTSQSRVTHIDFYRTKDGGSTFFYMSTIANPGEGNSVTVAGDMDDTELNTAIIAPSLTSNNRPPDGLTGIVYHLGRIWGITPDGDVRFSAHAIDGYINGVAEECWPPELVFNFNAPTSLMPTSEGLVVTTQEGKVYLIRGISKYDFDVKELLSNVSILAPSCITKDGDTLYAFTAGKQILEMSTNGVIDLGLPLSAADLATFDPTLSYIAVIRDGVKALLFLSNRDDRMFCYNFNNGTWSPVWTAPDSTVSIGAIGNVQTSVGQQNLLIGPKSGLDGYIWKLNTAINTDDGIPFNAFLQFGSFVIAEPDSLMNLEHLTVEATAQPTVSLLMNEISGTPSGTMEVTEDRPIFATATTIHARRFNPMLSSFSTACRHFQARLAWGAVDDSAELYGFGFTASEFGA